MAGGPGRLAWHDGPVTLIEVLVVLALVAAVAAVATGRVRGGLDDPTSTVPDAFPEPKLPPTPLTGRDLTDVRFALALRGYRMDQVDELLDRAADELTARDAEIERLRAQLTEPATGVAELTGPATSVAKAHEA